MAKTSKKEKKVEKDIIKVLGFLVLLVIVFLISTAIFRSFNTFEYEGLTFTKQKIGEIPLYHHYYYFDSNDGSLIRYNLYLRTDPRKNNVTVEKDNLIKLERNRPVYISVDSQNLSNCRYGVLGVGNLASFLGDNQIPVRNAVPLPTDDLIIDNNGSVSKQEVVTCENKPLNPVINLVSGDESKVKIEGNCYTLSINSCQVLEVIEKFEVESILDARARDSASS